jgi:hypothetical protein
MSDYVHELEEEFDVVIKVIKEVKDEDGEAHITSVIEKLKKENKISSKWNDKKKRDAIMVAAGKGILRIVKRPPNQLVIDLEKGENDANG